MSYSFKFSFDKTPRECEKCGEEYIPNAPRQKYCDTCRMERFWTKKDYKDRIIKNNKHS